MSLLAYCFYFSQDYANAAQQYEILVKAYGDIDEYKMYLAQSLHKAGMHSDAYKYEDGPSRTHDEERRLLTPHPYAFFESRLQVCVPHR